MYQQKAKDIEQYFKLEEMIENLELSTQKSLSLTALNVDVGHAFEEALSLMNEAIELYKTITDAQVKFIAQIKITLAINEFETKLIQVEANNYDNYKSSRGY